MINSRALPVCVLASIVLCSAASLAQQAAPAVRILTPIDESQLVTLKGNTSPHANAKNDRGSVSPGLILPDLTLVLNRSPEQEAAFETFISGQYDSSSPDYHQWLTPAEIGEQFGPAQADIATVTSWLTSHGFTVKQVTPDRMAIRFSGTAAQVESAFHTEIHNLSVNGAPHYANMSDPQIPAALAPVVVGVKQLHNFLPRPLHRLNGKVQFNREAGQWQRVTNSTTTNTQLGSSNAPAISSGPRPQFGINGNYGGNPYLVEDVTPWDFATIYNVIPAWNAGYTGANQTIAIAGTSLIAQSPIGQGSGVSESGNDVATFRSIFGLPALAGFQQIDTKYGPAATECTSTSPSALCGVGDLEENSIDVEWSGAVATGASIDLVVTGQNSEGTVDTVYDSGQYIVQNETARILNLSYGLCELYQGTAENVAYYNLWQSAAAEGISVFVAAGDSGSSTCDNGGDSIGWPYSAQHGLSVSGLASTPYDVAVGGTDFSWCKPTVNSSGFLVGCPTSSTSQGSPAYWSASNNTTTEPYESALGYVPETPWNDTCLNPILAGYLETTATYLSFSGVNNAEASCNFVQNDWNYIYSVEDAGFMLAFYVDTVGGSGGASNCVVNTTNPDSDSAGTCSTGATTTGTANGSIPLTNNGWQKPSWQTGVTGIPSDGVRDLPDVSFFAGDGTLYSASLFCVSATGTCSYSGVSENTAEEAGGTSFGSPAMAGVMALINQKAGAPQGLPNPGLYKLASQQTYANCSAETVKNSSSSCYFQSIDEGTNAMPCDMGASLGGAIYDGGWILPPEAPVYAGTTSPNCTALNSGDTVGTLVSSGTTPAYNATTGYNLATGLGSLNVYNVVRDWVSDAGTASSTLGVTLSPTGTISASTSLAVTVTVTGSGNLAAPTGAVVVSGGGYGAAGTLAAVTPATTPASSSVTITIPPSSLAVGSDTLTVTYSGDQTYASTSTTENVTVTAITPTVLVSAPASDNVHNPVYVTVTVKGPDGAATPAGTVSLDGSTAVTLSSTGTANFTINANVLTVGTDTLTANFNSTNSTYESSSGTATIVITGATPLTPTITVTPSPTSIDTSQSVNVTVTVTGSGAPPTGTVTLSGGTYSSSSTVLTGSAASFTIPGNSLSAGTPTLTANYSGDVVYLSGAATNNGNLTVTQSIYSLSASTPASVSPGSSSTSTITGTASSTDYTGTVTLSSCTLTSSSVTNPNAPPACSVTGEITYASGTPTGSGTATVFTTAASTSGLVRPEPAGKGRGWLGAGSGAVLALLIFFGIPARRRSWRSMLGILVAMVALGALSSCGGGGGGGTTTIPGTSAGTYTFTVSGTGNDPASTVESTTFTLTVN
ncbi:MAG: protease pro-enzyme activation domain-containing protein [Terracidiphilus sp.]|jgi:hypothetical protein